MTRKSANAWDVFFSHVKAGRIDECWLWEGTKYNSGYGQGWYKDKTTGAHRIAYMLFIGDIPEHLEVMHSCNNRLCVNPTHLSLGTHAENMAQTTGRRNGETTARGSRHGLSKLTESDVIEIWGYRNSGLSHREIGEMFGVTGTNITVILNRRMWQHVTDELPD